MDTPRNPAKAASHHRGWRGLLMPARLLLLITLNVMLILLLVKTVPATVLGTPLSAIDSASVRCTGSDAFLPPGIAVTFELNASGGERPYVYVWSFGDGSSNTSLTPSAVHVYYQFGEFEAIGKVYDLSGQSATASPIYVNANLSNC
jgi:hypothetical protein